MKRTLPLAAILAFVVACGGARSSDDSSLSETGGGEGVEGAVVIAEFDRMPSGIAVWEGRVFVSFPRWVEEGEYTVAELVDGELSPIGIEQDGDEPADLISVNGMHVDEMGRLWILDNARVNLAPAMDGAPKLVVWDLAAGEELFRHVFSPDVAPPAGSFLNDIVVSVHEGFAYITETGMGGEPALITYDIARDEARRVLSGHPALGPEDGVTTTILGEEISVNRPDGDVPWRVGVNAIALDESNGRLLFGPMTGRSLFSLPTLALRNTELSEEELAAQVSEVADKPLTDGIASTAERVFVTALRPGEVHAFGIGDVAVGDDQLEYLGVSVSGLSFPVAIEPTDGGFYVSESQFHRMPILRGDDLRQPPYRLLFVTAP